MLQMRSLGASGLRVTPIGLGLAAIGRPAYINVGRDADLGSDRSVGALRARAHELLDAALTLGVRYLDAARSYGLAEDFLASWLERRAVAPGDVTVGSKWGYEYTADWRVGAEVNEVKDHSATTLRRQIGESRALLGPWLRLYQIHSATIESGVLSDPIVLDELARLRDDGLVIGSSVSGPRQPDTIRALVDVRVDGRPLFGAVQATWNVLEPSAGEALRAAHDAGLGVIVKEALANGRLAGRWSGEPGAVLDRIAESRFASGGRAATADKVAIAAVLAQPWADVVLSGAVTPAQLASNVEAVALELSPEELADLERLAVPAPTYWIDRAALSWS